MRYQFLVETYETERLKVLSVWSMFREEDLNVRPREDDPRGRSVLEHMVHQSMSENAWFTGMLGIAVGAPPLPAVESIAKFIQRYAEDSAARLTALGSKGDEWWEEIVRFFDTDRSRAWVMVRRISHTSHHRGQQMAMLRMLGREVYSNYGPTADTGGLAASGGRVIYAYPGESEIVSGGEKAGLPTRGGVVSERPGSG